MSPSQDVQKEAEIFGKYIANRKLLIVDTSSTARSGLFRVLQELGAKTSQIILSNTFQQAKELIEQQKPHIVIAEYELGKRCGLDLLQGLREQNPDYVKTSLFLIVTGNTSQSAVAKAAEEDIDSYILKPFVPEVVRRIIIKAAIMKVSPPPYLKAIEEGKALLQETKLDEAEAKFKEAVGLDAAPSLAYYYLGQVKFFKKVISQAQGSYEQGLNFNKIHYKCLVGLYEILAEQKQHAQAYDIVKRISQYFPANPKRLAEVLRLAIINGKYEDIEKYYAVFCNIDTRDEVLIRYVCAALVVCGKYYLSSKMHSRALELFQKAAATGTGRTNILKEIILALLDGGLEKEAQRFVDKFPAETQASDDYLLMKFLVLNQEGSSKLILDLGRALLSKGIVNERLYEVMICRSLQSGLKPAAESIFQEAARKIPAEKTRFDRAMKTPQPRKPA